MADRSIPPGSYVLLGAGTVGYFAYLFAWFLLPAFLSPVIAELDLTSTQAGLLTGAVPLTYVPLGLASGLVVDRAGARRGIGIGLLLVGGAHAARGLAPGFPALLALTLVLGVGGTGVTFGLPKLVAGLFPPERSGTMSAVFLVGANLGAAAAFAVGRPVLDPALGGWRPAFLWTGLAVVAFAVAWLLGYPLARPPDDRLPETDDEGQAFSLASLRDDLGTVLSHRGLRLLIVIGTMNLFAVHGLQAWLATVLEVRGVGAGIAAAVASLFIVARTVGTVAIPAASDYAGTRRGAVVASGGFAAVGTAGLLAVGADPLGAALVASAIGFGIGGLGPLIRAIPIELSGIGPRLTATATGLIFAVGEIGGFGGPFLIGALRDLTGSFAPGIGLVALAGVVVAAAGYAMRPTDPR